MIHLKNAHAANTAMVGSVWFVLAAPLAMPPVARLLLLFQFYKWIGGALVVPLRIVSWDLPRVGQSTHRVAEKEHRCNVIEYATLDLSMKSD